MIYTLARLRQIITDTLGTVSDSGSARTPAVEPTPEVFYVSNGSGIDRATKERLQGIILKFQDDTLGFTAVKATVKITAEGPRVKVWRGAGPYVFMGKEEFDSNVKEVTYPLLSIGDRSSEMADSLKAAGVAAKMVPVIPTGAGEDFEYVNLTVGNAVPKRVSIGEALAITNSTFRPVAGAPGVEEGAAVTLSGLITVEDAEAKMVPLAWLAEGGAAAEFVLKAADATNGAGANVKLGDYAEYAAGLVAMPAEAGPIAVAMAVLYDASTLDAGYAPDETEAAVVAACSDLRAVLNGNIMQVQMDNLMDLQARISALKDTEIGCDANQAAALMVAVLAKVASVASATDGAEPTRRDGAATPGRGLQADGVQPTRLFPGADGTDGEPTPGGGNAVSPTSALGALGGLVPADSDAADLMAIVEMLGGREVVDACNHVRKRAAVGGSVIEVNNAKAKLVASDYELLYEKAQQSDEWDAGEYDFDVPPADWAEARARFELVYAMAQNVGGLGILADGGADGSGRSYARAAADGMSGEAPYKPPFGSVMTVSKAKESQKEAAMPTEVAAWLGKRDCIEAVLALLDIFAEEEAERGAAISAVVKLARLVALPKHGGYIRAALFSNRTAVSDVPGKAEMVAAPFLLADKVIALFVTVLKEKNGVSLAAKHRADILEVAESIFKGKRNGNKIRAHCGAVAPDDEEDQRHARLGQMSGPTASADAERAAGVVAGFLEIAYCKIGGAKPARPMLGLVRLSQKAAMYTSESQHAIDTEFWARLDRLDEAVRDDPTGVPPDPSSIVESLEAGKMVSLRHTEAAEHAATSFLGAARGASAPGAFKIPRTTTGGSAVAARQTGQGQPRSKDKRKGRVGGSAAQPASGSSSAVGTPISSPMQTFASTPMVTQSAGATAPSTPMLPPSVQPSTQTQMRQFVRADFTYAPGSLTRPLSMGRSPEGAVDALEALAEPGTMPCAWMALNGQCRKSQSHKGCPRCRSGHTFPAAAIAKVRAAMAPGLVL